MRVRVTEIEKLVGKIKRGKELIGWGGGGSGVRALYKAFANLTSLAS